MVAKTISLLVLGTVQCRIFTACIVRLVCSYQLPTVELSLLAFIVYLSADNDCF